MFLVFVELLIIAAAARDSRGTSKDISTDDTSMDTSPAKPMLNAWSADCPKHGDPCTTDSRCSCKSAWSQRAREHAKRQSIDLGLPLAKLVASVNPDSAVPELNCLTCDTFDTDCPYFEDTPDSVSRDQVGSRHEGCSCNYEPKSRPPWNEGSPLVKVGRTTKSIGVAFLCMEERCPIYSYLPGAGSVCASNYACKCPFPYQKIIRNEGRTCMQCASPICPLEGTLRCGEPGCVCPTDVAHLIVLKREELDAMNEVRAMNPGVSLGPENGACIVCQINKIAGMPPELLTADFYGIVAKYSGGTLEADTPYFSALVDKYAGRKTSDSLRELKEKQLREALEKGLMASSSKSIPSEPDLRRAAEDPELLGANMTSSGPTSLSVESPTRRDVHGTFTPIDVSRELATSLHASPITTPRVSARSVSGDVTPMSEIPLSARR